MLIPFLFPSPSELYDKFARMNRIDQAIFESEQEVANGAEAVDAEIVFAELEKKHFPSRYIRFW